MAMWNPWRGCKKYSEGCLHCYIHKGDAKRGVNTNDIIPVFYFDSLIPYKFEAENAVLADSRRNEVTNMSVNYVTVEESKDAEDKVTSCTVVIPYNNDCIREIKLKGDVRNKEEVEV